jgi:hypothetical protein
VRLGQEQRSSLSPHQADPGDRHGSDRQEHQDAVQDHAPGPVEAHDTAALGGERQVSVRHEEPGDLVEPRERREHENGRPDRRRCAPRGVKDPGHGTGGQQSSDVHDQADGGARADIVEQQPAGGPDGGAEHREGKHLGDRA